MDTIQCLLHAILFMGQSLVCFFVAVYLFVLFLFCFLEIRSHCLPHFGLKFTTLLSASLVLGLQAYPITSLYSLVFKWGKMLQCFKLSSWLFINIQQFIAYTASISCILPVFLFSFFLNLILQKEIL
jgi:hypothetical protein